jgi:hypothetical protein
MGAQVWATFGERPLPRHVADAFFAFCRETYRAASFIRKDRDPAVILAVYPVLIPLLRSGEVLQFWDPVKLSSPPHKDKLYQAFSFGTMRSGL